MYEISFLRRIIVIFLIIIIASASYLVGYGQCIMMCKKMLNVQLHHKSQVENR